MDHQRIRLTLAAAMIEAHDSSAPDHLGRKAAIGDMAKAIAESVLGKRVAIDVNTADRPPDTGHLSVTGTSAEAGDDGEADRGNRGNGLITHVVQ